MARSTLEQDAEFRDFITELFAVAAGMQSLRRAIGKRVGLGGTELGILLSLDRLASQGTVNIKQVAAHLHVAAAHITAEVNGLSVKGFVDKQTSEQDNRSVELRITKRGEKLLKSIDPNLQMINEALFGRIDALSLKTQRRFFRQVLAGMPHALARLPSPRGS